MSGLVERWEALTSRTRLLVALFGFAAACATAIAFAMQRDDRVALFGTPLEPEQVAEVSERLAAWNVAFAAAPDNVRVAAQTRGDLLLRLSLAGVPHAHLPTSTEMLEKAGPLVPESVLLAQQRGGLEGDIATTLRSLANVADARVIVAPADPGTYADDSPHEASASVRLTLRGGSSLGAETVSAIKRYVAAAVTGLRPERVALLDDRGSALDGGDASAGEASALATSLQSALDSALGAGATIVRVRATYDPRTTALHRIVHKPGTGAPKEAADVTDERVDTPAGRIEHLSVAVAVDAARGFDLAKIRSLANGTLGLDLARGDTLRVEAVTFARAATSPGIAPWAVAAGLLATAIPSLVLALAVLALVRYGAAPLSAVLERCARQLTLARTSRAIDGYPPDRVRGALRGEPPHAAAAIISALPAATATAVLEMYAPEERSAIVRRMARATAPAVPDAETVLRRA